MFVRQAVLSQNRFSLWPNIPGARHIEVWPILIFPPGFLIGRGGLAPPIPRSHRVTLRSYIFAFIFALIPALAAAQRLPEGVTPQHYALSFTPDLQKGTFSGEETIDMQIVKQTHAITLNSAELEFQQAEVTQGDKTQIAQTSFDTEKQQATLTVPADL